MDFYVEGMTPAGRIAMQGLSAAWETKPAAGADCLWVTIRLEARADGSFGPFDAHGEVRRWPDGTSSGAAKVEIGFIGSLLWLDPQAIDLFGVVTIHNASCRRHLLQGAEALRSALQAELLRTVDQHLAASPLFDELPSADELLEAAHA